MANFRRLRLIAIFVLPIFTLACLWDYDTLKQERARFPDALELITGKFMRHSKPFYEWRIQDRLQKLKSGSATPALYDDVAVAYEKAGEHAKAIETILEKEKLYPGLYETAANLGTFYILAGEFEKGLPFIDKALEINPDAHFGRERYQKWLVEYALAKRKNGKLTFPLRNAVENEAEDTSNPANQDFGNFGGFVRSRQNLDKLSLEEAQKAVKAVLGMMRFANHRNPLLLEALGDLLMLEYKNREEDAKRLAASAYLKASYEMSDADAKKRYEEMAAAALNMQIKEGTERDLLAFPEFKTAFDAQLADAEKWYTEFNAQELQWIKDGKNPEAEFDRLSMEVPPLAVEPPKTERSSQQVVPVVPTEMNRFYAIATAIILGCTAVAIISFRHNRKSNAPAKRLRILAKRPVGNSVKQLPK